MRYLLGLKNRRVKIIVFILIGCFIPAFVAHVFAYTTLEKKLYKQEHWQDIYGVPPESCAPSDDPNIAIVCGRALSGKQMSDPAGNYLANQPLPNMTVELWEQNPISGTGKLYGNLTNVFDSTQTNDAGYFQLKMRKAGPPNKSVYLVFKCGDEAQKPKRLDSWHDYWKINFQLGCVRPDGDYSPPKLPYTLVDSSSFLGCTYNANKSVATGMIKQEQPTVSAPMEAKNFDHRHTINTFNVTLVNGITAFLGLPTPSVQFVSPGGWWEADCLQKDELASGAGNGTDVKCGIPHTGACTWDSLAWSGGQLGSDTTECDGSTISGVNIADRLTRPFYSYIPKELTQEPYRRADVRANLRDFAEERYLGVAITSRLWGSGISDPVGNPHVYLRSYMAASNADRYISCEELQKRNNAFKTGAGKTPERNKYLNGGPMGGLAPESPDWERIYNAVINCDPNITDRTAPNYCNLRSPTDYICNDYVNGHTEKNNNAIRFCDIQPPFGDTAHCRIGDANCGGACGAGLSTNYILDKRYFSTEQMFANLDTANSMQTDVFNDSLETHYRTAESFFNLFNTETQSQARTETHSTRADSGGKQKGNSLLTAESMADIQDYVPGTEQLDEPLTSPFTNDTDDYEDLAVWKIYEIGSPVSYCGIGDPYNNRIFVGPGVTGVAGAIVENLGNLFPDNIFNGNTDNPTSPGQNRHKSISTSTWYMSEDATTRDTLLMDDGRASNDLMGLTGSAGWALDQVLLFMPARDVFDSVLSILHGDARMHGFVIDVSDIIQAVKQLSNDSRVKTFGDREPTGDPVIRSAYKVHHPLSEENFAYIPNRNPPILDDPANPNGIFVLPPLDSNDDANGTYGNPGQDGEALMPNDWTDTNIFPAKCYPFAELDEGGSCDSFREQPVGVSRTCRVDECKVYYLAEEGTCACTSATNCYLDGTNMALRNTQCGVGARLQCAQEQETTVRFVRHTDSEPDKMHLPNPPRNWDPVYYPSDRLSDADCAGVGTGYDVTVGGIQTFDIDGDSGPPALRCNVSRAGPMIGGDECNGTLEVPDFALRLENRPPDTAPTTQQFKTLDSSRTASLKLNNALLPPFQPSTDGAYVALLNGSHSDLKQGVGEGMYTYGAEMDTTGYANYSETSQYSTAPVLYKKDNKLKDLYFHCHLNGYTPTSTGTRIEEYKPEPYLIASAPYDDPDLGTVDDDGNGTFGDAGDKGWSCPIIDVPDPQWATYTNTSGNCAIHDIGSCLADPNVPDTLPQSFFDTVNMAAGIAQTPAAILVAILAEESGFASPGDYWNNNFKIQMWGRPWYGRIDAGGSAQCDDNVGPAQGPYQMLRDTWLGFMRNGDVAQSFENISRGRSLTASRCNFLDASILAAYHLKDPVSGNPFDYGGAGNCGSAYNPDGPLSRYSGGSYNTGQSGRVISIFNSCNH